MRMPVILRALPLSLGTLWRYLIMLPFMLVVLLVLGLFSLIPFLGLVALCAAMTYSMVVGIACALLANGRVDLVGFMAKLQIATIFGLLNMVVALLTTGLSLLFGNALSIGPFAGWGLPGSFDPGIDIPSLLLLAWMGAMAVPMAAVVVDGRKIGSISPLRGFGVGTLGLLVINLIGLYGSFALWTRANGPAIVAEAKTALTTSTEGPSWEPATTLDPIFLVASLAFLLWWSCWFSAAAVLYWEDKVKSLAQTDKAEKEAARMSSDDIRALRLAREQQRNAV